MSSMLQRAREFVARGAGLGLALCAIGWTACDQAEFSTQNTQKGEELGASSLSGGAPPQTLIQRMTDARQQHAFQGIRRVELHFEESGEPRTVELRERVSSNGQGQFALEALEVIQPQMSVGQYSVFLSLQSLRQGMNWRYRDFAIENLALFQQNYRFIDTGATGEVAGFPTQEFRVERIDGSGSIHLLSVETVTGLVLAAREQDAEGQLISAMDFDSFALAPDLSAVAWHQRINDEQPLPVVGTLAAQIGFEPRSPRTLPAGFQLVERGRLVDPTDQSTWVKATYSDGLECIFFLHGGPIVSDNGIRSGVPEIKADLVEVAVAAPWVVARGNLRGERVLVLGKVPEQELLGMLRSAME